MYGFFWNLAKWSPVWVPKSVQKIKKFYRRHQIMIKINLKRPFKEMSPLEKWCQSWSSTHFVSFVPHYTSLNSKNNNGYNLFVLVVGRGVLWLQFVHLSTVMRNFLIWVKAGQGTHTSQFGRFWSTLGAKFNVIPSKSRKNSYIFGTLLFLNFLMNFSRLLNSK